MIKMLVAMNKIGTIGINNGLPWKIKDDLALFKKHTLNTNILMGRKTFKSIGLKPLPKRTNIVISSQLKSDDFDFKNLIISNDLEKSIKSFSDIQEDLWIIGGREIYLAALPYIERAYVSVVDNKQEGDTVMPLFWKETYMSGLNKWKLLSETDYAQNHNNECAFSFKIFEKINQ